MLSKIENEEVETYLQNLSATDNLIIRCGKQPNQCFAKHYFRQPAMAKTDLGRANEIVNHLCEQFKPFPREVAEDDERFITNNCSNEKFEKLFHV